MRALAFLLCFVCGLPLLAQDAMHRAGLPVLQTQLDQIPAGWTPSKWNAWLKSPDGQRYLIQKWQREQEQKQAVAYAEAVARAQAQAQRTASTAPRTAEPAPRVIALPSPRPMESEIQSIDTLTDTVTLSCGRSFLLKSTETLHAVRWSTGDKVLVTTSDATLWPFVVLHDASHTWCRAEEKR